MRRPRKQSRLLLLTSAAYVLYVFVCFGFELLDRGVARAIGVSLSAAMLAQYALAVYRSAVAAGTEERVPLRETVLEVGLVLVTLVAASAPRVFLALSLVPALHVLLRTLRRTRGWQGALSYLEQRPARLLVSGFAVVILVGTVLLTLPSATTDHEGASPVDALFTSASATCVTGLAVLNTAPDERMNCELATFSTFGQVVILLLIQIGGLGIMTLSASLLVLAGRGLAARSRQVLGDLLEESAGAAIERAIMFILRMTLACELIGAGVLYLASRSHESDVGDAAYSAIFHAISAFNNAGFSLHGDSLVRFRSDPLVCMTVSTLIVIGGLGYSVVAVLFSPNWFMRGRVRRQHGRLWNAHARMVGVMTALLLAGGMLLTFYLEYDASLAGLSLGDKLMASFFQSVTARTAGFNTVDISAFQRTTLLIYMVWMFIGASPGGTGGGVKTTTVGVFFLSVRAFLRRRSSVEAWGQRFDSAVVHKAVSIIAISVTVIVLALLGLLASEPQASFEALVFEVVSAFGTVGLSVGLTPTLSVAGKLIVVALMFVGRLGPVTMALAFTHGDPGVEVTYASARIAVG
ncbi:MAG: Trk family potassium uptake protein [Deltaproteobacteria bacterium]|nr:Trk family potassium uptake protein [Deltaproteobacteria bacterium]